MRRLSAIAVALLATSIATAQAQPYPSRPVRIIVAVSAGGGDDTVTRIVADQVSRRLQRRASLTKKSEKPRVETTKQLSRAPVPTRQSTQTRQGRPS